MKKFIKKGLIILALSAQIAPAFAGSNDYKPSHGGYSGAPQARRATNLSDLPEELHREIAKFLSPSSFGAFASSCKNVAPLGRDPIVGFRAAKNGTPVYDLQGNISYTDRVSHAFADLGKMHKVAGLIWSGVAPRTMNLEDAVAYCAGRLGGNSRLPTKDEYNALSRAMGSRQPDYEAPGFDVAGYNRNLIPGMNNQWFWSASARPRYGGYAFGFNGFHGVVDDYYRYDYGSVRCVVGGL